jgi:uncharacterized protein YcbX
MQGESLTSAHIYWHGFDGDRRYAFVQSGNHSSFPWLTGRQIPELVQYAPRYTTENVINGSLAVNTPAGNQYDIKDEALREELAAAFGKPIHLMQLNRGVYDDMSLSVMSNDTVRGLCEMFGAPLDKRRFRQNIIIDMAYAGPYQEEAWAGKTLIFGQREDSPRITLTQRIPRCQMINIDPDTAERDARVLKGVVATREQCVGMHAWPVKIGRVHVGDEIRLI